MLFYIKYGCSYYTEELIVSAHNKQTAEEYARVEAEDVYFSYSNNCLDRYEYDDLTEEEFEDMEYQVMSESILYYAEPYDLNNEKHQDLLSEQGGLPFDV